LIFDLLDINILLPGLAGVAETKTVTQLVGDGLEQTDTLNMASHDNNNNNNMTTTTT